MDHLPFCIYSHILDYCNLETLLVLCQVSKTLNINTQHYKGWKVLLNDYNNLVTTKDSLRYYLMKKTKRYQTLVPLFYYNAYDLPLTMSPYTRINRIIHFFNNKHIRDQKSQLKLYKTTQASGTNFSSSIVI